MKFLIVDEDYPGFMRWIYAQHPGLEALPYEDQRRTRNESLYDVSDFYPSNLRKLGQEAWDIHANNEFMQRAWAREHGLDVEDDSKLGRNYDNIVRHGASIVAKTPLRYLGHLARPVLHSLDAQQRWVYDILAEQIKYYKPDVLLNQAMGGISTRFLKDMKTYVRLLVGQHAATRLSGSEDWGCYDLGISSFPPTLDWFRQKGVPAELSRLGFDPSVLSYIKVRERSYDVTFIGSFLDIHSSRTALLESLCNRFEKMRIWGPSIEHLPRNSAIWKNYVGQAWGRGMYQILRNSKITLNHHGDVPPYANNLRLYEATGVGTFLITDWKRNLHEMFELGKEVVAYRSAEECIELIGHYLKHDDERETIARAGQQRTLREHTYYQRMQQLLEILKRYMP